MTGTTHDAILKHQQEHGCTLKAWEPGPVPYNGEMPTPHLGYFGFPMDQPSNRQHRTTEHPFVNARQRHPTNPNKLLSILTWQEQNPDTWPDGNPT